MIGARRALAPVALLALAAWDTPELGGGTPANWSSIYYGHDQQDELAYMAAMAIDGAFDDSVFIGNEHAEIAHVAMLRLGWGTGLYLRYSQPYSLIDLNASVYRPDLVDALPAPGAPALGDDPFTVLVERDLPHPARFAGVPDFSYTVYDWINRNTLCPGVPPGELFHERCHYFVGWLGMIYNASHWGNQAEAMYLHFHQVAVGLAINARWLRQSMEDAEQAGVIDREEADAFVQEAELEALIYEAFAQHFLQDRWSSGHMWNRWNGGSYETLHSRSFEDNAVAGAVTGIIHGAEGILKNLPDRQLVPDAMCSPWFDGTSSTPMTFAAVINGQTQLVPGVGDYRFRDMLRGWWGDDYRLPLMSLDVSVQERAMMTCSQASWLEIARTFAGDAAAGWHGLPLDGPMWSDPDRVQACDASGFCVECGSAWATNSSMLVGLETLGPRGGVDNAYDDAMWGRTLWMVEDLLNRPPLAEIVDVAWRMAIEVAVDPDGLTLARDDAIGSLNGIPPGSAFVDRYPPFYAEPLDFETLPYRVDDWSPSPDYVPGRDKHTVYGFFNKAHVTYWCENAHDHLQGSVFSDEVERLPIFPLVPLTPEERERRVAGCSYLADRLYRGTDEAYLGEQAETRRVGHQDASGAAVPPPCDVFGATPEVPWEDGPVRLRPGYVVDGQPYKTTSIYGPPVYQSIVNWCRHVPVIDVDDQDVAATTTGTGDARTAVITGLNFRGSSGGAYVLLEGCGYTGSPEVIYFGDREIEIRVPERDFPPTKYKITVVRGDGEQTWGRAWLLPGNGSGFDAGFTMYPPGWGSSVYGRAFHPYCPGEPIVFSRIADCTGAPEVNCDGLTSGVLLYSGGFLRPNGEVAADGVTPVWRMGPFEGHRWRVTYEGPCVDTGIGLPCDTAYLGEWGIDYRIEGIASDPTPDPPQLWNYALDWTASPP